MNIHVSEVFEVEMVEGATHIETYPSIKTRKSSFWGLKRIEYENEKKIIEVTQNTPLKITVEADIVKGSIWKAILGIKYWCKSVKNKKQSLGYKEYYTDWYHLSESLDTHEKRSTK